MDHRQKVVNAIEAWHRAKEQLRGLEYSVINARRLQDEAGMEVARQIKNVIGADKDVLHEGWIYRADKDGNLICRESGLVVLENTK